MKEPLMDVNEVFDVSPYLKLFIDKDGKWFQNGAEIIHPGIYKQFCGLLRKGPDGGYFVKMGREVCRVEVEDAPFVIFSVVEDQDNGLSILLNDGTSERLNPELLVIGAGNVPYCDVKNGFFAARFSRNAYYQLAEHIESNEDGSHFCLVVGSRKYPVKVKDIASKRL
jgi:uncharacterized protein